MIARAARLLSLAALMASCSASPPSAADPQPARESSPRLVERARVSMGSEVRLTAWTADEPNALLAFEHIFDDFDNLDRILSVWHEDSDISKLNAAAGTAAVAVKPEVMEVLQIAQQVSGWTERKVRRDLRRALGAVEIRPRSGQPHPGRG
jgi:thiamine biosynthesis lipoprotein